MVHNNPGEKPYETKYNDPYFLKGQGFNGAVTHWHVNCAITYDNYIQNLVPLEGKERKWIESKAAEIDTKLKEFERAGIAVYPFTDFIVFPQSVWEKYGEEITGMGNVGGTGGMDARARKPDLQNKRTQDLLIAQIDAIFNRFPELDGLTLRFGETYLHDTPYHLGGNPIRSGEDAIKDHVLLLTILREEICVKRGKKLFYRTWDFGYNFHNNPDFYLAVTNQISPHPNLIFSIKYQQGDYHRMTPFNPTLGIGKHQQIVESQSRMEAYGKGAHPYYTAKGVIEGWPETKYEINFSDNRFTGKLNETSAPRGVRDVLSSGLIKGVMTWSNGGGWQGPYIKHEIWTDLNTNVVAGWAQHPDWSEERLFYRFAQNLGFNGLSLDLFRQLTLLTVEGVRKGHCCSFTANDVWWTRDEFFSAAVNLPIINEILQKGIAEQVLAEKAEAVAIWQQIENLSKEIVYPTEELKEAIQISCSYGRIKYQLIESMWILMLERGRINRGMGIDRLKLQSEISKYDKLWDEWRVLEHSSKFCATIYSDLAFRNQKSGSIGELVDSLRKLCR